VPKSDEEAGARTWLLRIASVAGMIAAVVAIGVFMHRGQTFPATMLLFVIVALGVMFSWSWTGSLFSALARAKSYVEGVEGDSRHEWYAFKGQRVRVFLDANQQPWFALNEIAYILSLQVDEKTFRHYGARELGTPESASEKCLSERGLRRLIRHSTHADAGALGLWLERDVLRMLKNRAERNAA
jgi:hypothetical protein